MYRMKLQTLAALSLIVFVWAFYPQVVMVGGDVVGTLTAQVGVGAGVAPSEFSELAAQIDAKERELEAREAALLEAEERAEQTVFSAPFTIEWYVTLLAFILLILVLLNFYLDYRHRERSLT